MISSFKMLCFTVCALTIIPLALPAAPVCAASITEAIPASAGVTTNTTILLKFDTKVAMIGTAPDMSYCVTKLSTSGFDYVFSDVPCDVAAADDRKSVTLYPQALLDNSSQYAYKVVSINFQGGGSAQNFSQCFSTGGDPLIPPASAVLEVDLCNDYNNGDGYNGMAGGNYCFRCHVGEYTKVGVWPVGTYPPAPPCTP